MAAVLYARTAAAEIWTETLAVARAEARAPRVQTARAALDTARATTAYSRVPILGNPLVGLRAMVGLPDSTAATYAVYLGFPFDVGGSRGRWRREAEFAIAEAQAELDAVRIDARADARLAYAEAAVAAERVRVTSARLETARELLARTEARYRASAANELDRTLADREVAIAEAELAGARRDRDAAFARFRSAVDLGPNDPVEFVAVDAPLFEPGLTREAAIQRAIAQRPEPRALAATRRRWLSAGDRLRAEAIAPLVVAAEAEYQSYQYLSFGVSMNWSLPILHTAQGPRANARAEAAMAEVRRTTTIRDLGRQAAAAWDALRGALDEYHALHDHAVPALERTLALTETLLEAGNADWFRVLLARQELASARLRALDALRAAWNARVSLDRITARP
jgi:cobalt-zinc-cadmium efflux system outer membrane protein